MQRSLAKLFFSILSAMLVITLCSVNPVNAYYLDENGVLGIQSDQEFLCQLPYDKSSIASIKIENGITIVPSGFFSDYENLESIIIHDSITSIADEAFYNCPSLDFVVMNADAYNPNAFDSDMSANVHFYYDITYVSNGHGTISGKTRTYDSDVVELTVNPDECYSVESITVNGEVITGTSFVMPSEDAVVEVTYICGGAWGDNLTWFYDEAGTLTISGTGDMGNAIPPIWYSLRWYFGIDSVVVEDGVTSIGEGIFYDWDELTSITISDSVTTISKEAFYDCDNLTSVEIPGSVTCIGEGAFGSCDNLSTVVLSEGVTAIGRSAFAGCSSLTELDIPDSVNTLGIGAFGSTGLISITIPDGVTELPDWLFLMCHDLVEVSLPDSITRIGDSCFTECFSLTNIEIPENINYIDSYAFSDCFSLTNLTIPDGVVYIGEGAFESTPLTSLIIPDGVSYIGDYAFGDSSLEFVVMNPDAYNSDAFKSRYGSSYTNCTVHFYYDIIYTNDGYGTISGNTRAYDTEIVELTVTPDEYCSVGTITVNGEAITGNSFVMPSGDATVYVDFISDYQPIDDNESYSLDENGVLTITGVGELSTEPSCDKSSITSIVIEDGITSVPSSFFSDCENLTSVTLPDSVTAIDDGAFSNCRSLDFVVMNSHAYNPNAFDSDTAADIHFYYDITYTSNGHGTISGMTRTYDSDVVELTVTPDDMYIVDSITVNGIAISDTSFVMPEDDANVEVTFSYIYDTDACGSNLTWHYAPAILTISGSGAMFDFDPSSMEAPWNEYSNDIRTVVIEDGVTTIGANAFAGCINLSSIEFPDSLVAIGDNAFLNCSSLSRLMIPDNVSYLGDGAFSNCSSISFVAMNSDAYNPDAFDSATTSKVHFYYDITYVVNGHGTVTGETRTYDSDYVSLTITPGPLYQFDSMTINGVNIGFQAASTCITQDTIVEVTFVPRFPFSGVCGDNLTWMYDYDSATLTISGTGDMDDYANTGERPWNNLLWYTEKIVIENGVTSIGDYAFCSSSVNYVSIPESVNSIGNGAFNTCRSLTDIEIPSSVNTIGEGAFSMCSNLLRITIPEGVTELPASAFSSCSNLVEVSLPESLTTIGPRCFDWCYDLVNIEIPNNVTRIEEYAFYDCNSITTMILPDSVEFLGEYAFESCDNLTEVRLPVTLTSISNGVFSQCRNIDSMTVNYYTYINNRFEFAFVSHLHFYVRVGIVVETNSNHDSSLYGEPDFDSMIDGDRIIETMVVTDADSFELPAYLESQGINVGTVVLCGANSSIYELTPDENGMYHVTYAIAPATYYTDPANDTGEIDYQVGYLVVIYEACDHANVTVDQAVAPYCTTTGLTEGSHCAYCGEVLIAQNVIDALGHDVVIDAAVAPGCLTDGASQGSHCGRCYEILVARQTIPYTGHTPVVDPAFDPDCTHAGGHEGSHCGVCGAVIVPQGYISPLGHTEVIQSGIAPDCTHSGMTSGSYCSVCHTQLITPRVIPATGHSVIHDSAVAPTCTQSGLSEGCHCRLCGEVIMTQNVVPATGHTVVATTTRTGLTAGSHCSTCGAVIVAQQVVPRLTLPTTNNQTSTPSSGTTNNQSAASTTTTPRPSTSSTTPSGTTSRVSVSYATHVQNIGWQENVYDGAMSGTEGMALRLEAMTISIDSDADLGIRYRTHVQNVGWQDWVYDGDIAGTSGRGLRLEAMQIELTGSDAANYDVYYRVHVQNVGWMDWVKNGELAGTEGRALRLEGMQIKIVPKNRPANFISYNTHVQNVGWQDYVTDGVMAGTSGQSLRLEGIHIRVDGLEGVGVEYRTHIQNIGWESNWAHDGGFSGTEGRSLRLEAIEIRLTGANAANYDTYYRTHVQNFGWTGWASNGASSGSAGYAYRLEGIEIVIVPHGTAAPGSTSNSFYQA